ncbi:MAG: CoA pyrophosphatase [Phenylobacterium sp.]|uniref:CoA pyrophosphatase n=1 Tax=Phenylobacterium sp. TaxID=1871053 RepID=UPI001A368959|nr:CoA pyrophosphatase [Phenylobacterium sp.]MBL8555704.1 CoA pyrophosphatase [Phenylobacterium sp.]
MNAHGPVHELADWIAEHLDPLHDETATDGRRRSDFDLTPGGWSGQEIGDLTPAAVLIGLVQRDAGVNVLLTRRADTLRRHTGQVALPGGRRDPGETAVQTALREAHEEVGLEPRFVAPIGLSTPYQTGTGYLITPVVGLVRPGFSLIANPGEVADIFETPFAFLMDMANYEEHERELPTGEKRRFYATTHDEQYIWGATAGILRALYERLYGAALA